MAGSTVEHDAVVVSSGAGSWRVRVGRRDRGGCWKVWRGNWVVVRRRA